MIKRVVVCLAAFIMSLAAIADAAELTSSHYTTPTHNANVLASNGTFVFNPRTHKYYAISGNGTVVKQGRASGGRAYCPDIRRSCRTPSGAYRVISKGGAGCRSSRYPVGRGGAPMPYCMFFSQYYAVHGSYDVPNYNASHGCIRVRPSDARWLSNNFMKPGTRVIVKPY
ncbi:MAG: L,D-transpeptidase [Legionellaceae bacterium]|nr:L,D-transpeptidase [Legionellaceae bacterium]